MDRTIWWLWLTAHDPSSRCVDQPREPGGNPSPHPNREESTPVHPKGAVTRGQSRSQAIPAVLMSIISTKDRLSQADAGVGTRCEMVVGWGKNGLPRANLIQHSYGVTSIGVPCRVLTATLFPDADGAARVALIRSLCIPCPMSRSTGSSRVSGPGVTWGGL